MQIEQRRCLVVKKGLEERGVAGVGADLGDDDVAGAVVILGGHDCCALVSSAVEGGLKMRISLIARLPGEGNLAFGFLGTIESSFARELRRALGGLRVLEINRGGGICSSVAGGVRIYGGARGRRHEQQQQRREEGRALGAEEE
jgi:hypothetical protein